MKLELKAVEQLPDIPQRAGRNVMDISKYNTKSDAMKELIEMFIEKHRIGQETYEKWRDKIHNHFK